MLHVGTAVSVDAKLARQMRSARRWPTGLPLTAKIIVLAEAPGPAHVSPSDPCDYLVKFPGGNEEQLSQMFLCPSDPPFVKCGCAWHPS